MKGILRRVKGYGEVAAESLTNPASMNSDEQCDETFDGGKKDRVVERWYVEGVDGKAYRVNQRDIEDIILGSLPKPVINALIDGHEIGVEFSTTDKPRGKYLWVKKIKFSDIDELTSWANCQLA